MGITQPYQIDHPEIRERWEQRYGDGPVNKGPRVIDLSTFEGVSQLMGTPLDLNDDDVRIGNEIFKRADLQKAHEEHPQHPSDPRKPHHYVLQNELTAMVKEKKQSLWDWNAELEKTKRELQAFREKFPNSVKRF